MELRLAVVTPQGDSKDLVLEIDHDATCAALYDLLGQKLEIDEPFSLHLDRIDEGLVTSDPLALYALRDGDLLTVTSERPDRPSLRKARLALTVESGSQAGRYFPLEPDLTLGRSLERFSIDFDDDSISSVHARIVATPDGLAIEDARSTNGTWVNGTEIAEPAILHAGDRITLGETDFEVFEPASTATPGHITPDEGKLTFNRPPRPRPHTPTEQIPIPEPPESPARRRLPLAASLIPVGMGLGLVIFFNNAYYLFFMIGGPLMALTTWWSDRRSGRADFKQAATRFREALTQIESVAAEKTEAAAAWRRDRDPDPTEVYDRLAGLDDRIWRRRPHDPDFMSARIGAADRPSLISLLAPASGSEDLQKQANSLAGRFEIDRNTPVTIDLEQSAVVGVHGHADAAEAVARWLVIQSAAHQSPRDVTIAALAPHHAQAWDWLKWLPHTETGTLDPPIPTDDDSASETIATLESLVRARRETAGQMTGATREAHLPHVVVVVEPPLQLPAAESSRLLDEASGLGVTFVWIARDSGALPNQCSVVVDADRGDVRFLDQHQQLQADLDLLSSDESGRFARLIAPLVDATRADGVTSIPASTGLLELLGEAEPRPRWSEPGPLAAIIGASTQGPLILDLEADGPHALVAGTTGAGKSELLQTLIASLALEHGPDRVNFVLIDYKGGAAFKDCVDLPHVVGFVTDLDEHLAERAITSLNAELRRRERILRDGGFKDLREMRGSSTDAPPSLVMIVDEFAALKTEVPQFVDGVVDIAQRGRSLGVHLVLATQKPRGVIDQRIQANTNIRIALRVTDADESLDVIGVNSAARLSRRTPGRAYLRVSETELTEFQTAYVGGPMTQPDDTPADPARTYRITPALREGVQRGSKDGVPELGAIVAACISAAEGTGRPRRPWLPPLPDSVALDELSQPTDSIDVAVGRLDMPERQSQDEFVLELGTLGSAIVLGTSGSGKTTTLRTIAAGLASARPTSEVHVYGLDFAGRALASLTALPHCGDVVFGDDLERVRAFLGHLEAVARDRRRLLAEAGAATIGEYRRSTGQPLADIVALIDGFGQLWNDLETIDRGSLLDGLIRLIGEGRSAGITFVVTADRRASLPTAVWGAIPQKLVLRLADADDYSAAGLRTPAGFSRVPPGRGWTDRGEIQIAAVGKPPFDAAAQTEGIRAVANASERVELPAEIRTLPEVVPLDKLPVPEVGSLRVPIGLADGALDVAWIDFARTPAFLIVGPPGSGRSTALETLAHGLRAAHPDAEFLLSQRRPGPLDDLEWAQRAQGPEQTKAMLEGLDTEDALDSVRRMVVIDDADDLADGPAAGVIDALINGARDSGTIVLIAMTSFKALRAYTGWTVALRHQRAGLILQPDDGDGDVFHVSLPRRSGAVQPAGRGHLVNGQGQSSVIQTALRGQQIP